MYQTTLDAQSYDVALIGGGIVGLATARELLRRHPELRLVVLEKEPDIARHQTSHNSGVIHAGIYYRPGSLKAQLCVRGKRLLQHFCDTHQIPYQLCGKVIVATHPSELPRLQQLYERGQANGVPGLELIGPAQLHELEPHVVGLQALYSPATGIIDFAQVARALAYDLLQRGGIIRTSHTVQAIEQQHTTTRLITSSGPIITRVVISCAGLYADRLAQLSGNPPTPQIVPFRGDYYLLQPARADLVRSLIYPVPDPRFPFLGVHFTRRLNGSVWLGPNAVLAFAREGYQLQTLNPADLLQTLRYSGFQRLASTYWRAGLAEIYRDVRKNAFLTALQRYIPTLRPDDLGPGPAGVRAQALNPDGTLVDDFVVNQTNRTLHVRNAPSPAATAALAIAELIADKAQPLFADSSFALSQSLV